MNITSGGSESGARTHSKVAGDGRPRGEIITAPCLRIAAHVIQRAVAAVAMGEPLHAGAA